jgi:RNA-directed DNA polymerase
MQTSLRGIANKAAKDKTYRFRNLFGMLTEIFLHQCWSLINKKSAKGVDKVSAKEYEENLHSNIASLVERVKNLSYRARLILRCFIPKIGGKKLRPLGIPVTEDKLLQMGVAKILEAIFESIFLPCSFGYRPKLSAHDAIKDISYNLFKGYNYIVEADIRGFFDNINHELLMKMLEYRIDDKPFLKLLLKWLKAGVLIEGKVINPATGTPQGGIVSPILANIYLHYVLDIWFENVVKQLIFGRAYLCRYADDFICAFQSKTDAELFFKMLRERMAEFGLELAEEKTRIMRFSRYCKEDETSFDFLGFEFRWETTRTGRDKLSKRTSRQKLRNAFAKLKEWCKENRNRKTRDIISELNTKLRGYYNYYGIIGNFESLSEFFYHAMKMLFKWLNRRSQKKSYNWSKFKKMLNYYKILKPRITERRDVQLCLPF